MSRPPGHALGLESIRLLILPFSESPALDLHAGNAGATLAQRESARHLGAGDSERVAHGPLRVRAGKCLPTAHGCRSPSCVCHVRNSFRHAVARECACQWRCPAAAGGAAKREGIRPSDSSADPPGGMSSGRGATSCCASRLAPTPVARNRCGPGRRTIPVAGRHGPVRSVACASCSP